MLTIYFSNGAIQVLSDFGKAFYEENKSKYKLTETIKDLVNDIAKGDKVTYTWQHFD